MLRAGVVAAAAAIAMGCGSNSSSASAAAASATPALAQSGDTGHSRRAGGGGAEGAGGGNRPIPTITLAPTDIAPATIESLEEGTPITGDLLPIETVDVRARLEGDLLGVYVREGQQVSAGQLLARFDATEQQGVQESAEADRASAKTDLSTAQWNLDQSAELYKAGAIAERDYKVAQQTVDAARARLAAAEAKLRTASLASRDTRVLAPASGIVDKRSVENGERVTRGTSMFTIVRHEVLELAAAVPARQASAVRVGQSVHFVADGKSFDGRVARVSPTIDPTSRSITVYVEVPNQGGALKGGTFASGRVVSRVIEGALTVPAAAIRQSQEGGHPFVYRIEGRVVNPAPIQIGVVDERLGRVEVLSGISVGDRVIVGNVGTLGRGMQVQILGGAEERRPGGPAGGEAGGGQPRSRRG